MYLNLFEAGLAKSLLDDHNVFCCLFDENAHLYGGAPFAMPVRLVVMDAHFERAVRILADARRSIHGNGDLTTDAQIQQAIGELDRDTLIKDRQAPLAEALESDNPWEILAIAYLFLVPGVGFLLERRSLILLVGRLRWSRPMFIVFSPLELHFVGVFLVMVALLLTLLYFYAGRLMARNAAQ